MFVYFLFFLFGVFVAIATWLVAKKRWKALGVVGGVAGVVVVTIVGTRYFGRQQEHESYEQQNELIDAGGEAYWDGDSSLALGYFENVVENYDSSMMETEVGAMYDYGEDTDVDYAEAGMWLERAAGKAHPETMELSNTSDFSTEEDENGLDEYESEPGEVTEPAVDLGAGDVFAVAMEEPVDLPRYGCFPGDNEFVCYMNEKGQQFQLKYIIDEGEQTIRISARPSIFNSMDYLLTGSDGDTFEFTEFTKGFNIPVYGYKLIKQLKKLKVEVSKDWKWVRLYDGTVYDIPITKELYDRMMAYKTGLVEKGRLQSVQSGRYSGNVSSSSNGGHVDESSSSGSFDSKKKCPYCNNGTCRRCHGTGLVFNSSGGGYDECPSCQGRGTCRICYGTGYIRY